MASATSSSDSRALMQNEGTGYGRQLTGVQGFDSCIVRSCRDFRSKLLLGKKVCVDVKSQSRQKRVHSGNRTRDLIHPKDESYP